MSLNTLLNIGASGIRVHQNAMLATSHNIANANTDGFSRQRVNIVQTANRYSAQISGNGAAVGDTVRVTDALVDKRIRDSERELGRLESRDKYLPIIENVFNEFGVDNERESGILVQRLNDFFDAADSMSADPFNLVGRSAVLQSAEALTKSLKDMANSINEIAFPIDKEVDGAIDEINGTLRTIRELNDRIVAFEGSSDQALDLRDQMEHQVRHLANYIDIDSFRVAEGGIAILTGSGKMLMGFEYAAQIQRSGTYRTESGELFSGITLDDKKGDITDSIVGGQLKGLLELRNDLIHGREGALSAIEVISDEIRWIVNREHSVSVGRELQDEQTGVFDLGGDTTGAKIQDLVSGQDLVSSEIINASVGEIDARHEDYPGTGVDVAVRFDFSTGKYAVTHDGTAASYSPVYAPTTYPGQVDLGWTRVSLPSEPQQLKVTDFAATGTLIVDPVDSTNTNYPGPGKSVVVTYNAADDTYGVTVNGVTAGNSPVNGPASPAAAGAGNYPAAVDLGWTKLNVTTLPTNASTISFTSEDPIRFEVPTSLAPPDMDRVKDGTIKIAYGTDADGMRAFEVVIDPASMTINDVVNAVNKAALTSGFVTSGSFASVNSDNRFVLDVPDGNLNKYGIVEDTSGFLAAVGVGAFFTGSGAGDLAINSEISRDTDRMGASRLRSIDGVNYIFDNTDNAGARAMADLRSEKININGVSASVMTHYSELVGKVGTWTKSNNSDFLAATTSVQFLENFRESVSGVSVEEELTNIIRFQQSFQAASKIINSANEMLETLIQIL